MIDSKIIGSRLKNLRGEKTIERAAADLEISPSALGMYETGKRIPRDEVKCKIASYYNTSVEAIFFAI